MCPKLFVLHNFIVVKKVAKGLFCVCGTRTLGSCLLWVVSAITPDNHHSLGEKICFSLPLRHTLDDLHKILSGQEESLLAGSRANWLGLYIVVLVKAVLINKVLSTVDFTKNGFITGKDILERECQLLSVSYFSIITVQIPMISGVHVHSLLSVNHRYV